VARDHRLVPAEQVRQLLQAQPDGFAFQPYLHLMLAGFEDLDIIHGLLL
jgi:hypothetical protein